MPSKNIKQVLVDGANLPLSVEASLPEGLPKVSSMLTNIAASLPTTPDLPMAIPDLPQMPAFTMPGIPGAQATQAQQAPPAPAKRQAPAFKFE
jgi:hypothetical protein